MPDEADATEPGELSDEQIEEFIKKPLRQLPKHWRLVVWDFWAFFSLIMPNQLPLCVQIRHWMDRDRLTLEELKRAFDKLRRVSACGEFQFGSQVLSALAREIDGVRVETKRRKQDEALREYYKNPATSGVVTDLAETFRRRIAIEDQEGGNGRPV